MNINEFALVGHSFGGWISTVYALKYKNPALNHIILIASAGIRDDSFKDNYKYLIPLLEPSKFLDILLYASFVLFFVLGQKDKWLLIVKLRKDFKERPVASSFFLQKFKSKDRGVDTVDHLLHELDVLTLVISGEQDKVIPVWHSKTFANKIRNSQSFFIPMAAHDLIETHPSQISGKIHDFISSTLKDSNIAY